MRPSSLYVSGWKYLHQCTFRPIPPRLCRASSSLTYHTPPLDFPAIDAKWQKIWADEKLGKFNRKKDGKDGHPTYVLPMFPYPSGSLHMGHIRVYTISDVLARFNYMRGINVIHPMGWDAFGLPAENAAIERGVDPAEWTVQNIEQMKRQLQAMNGVWDWDRELRTCDPAYYKHTQRLFLMMHEAGLAYQKEALVNWDPIDRTVLANEQVDANGYSWRSGAKVEQRNLKQWFLAITRFANELLLDLKNLEESNSWPSRVVEMQRNWLGKSSGIEFEFDLEATGTDGAANAIASTFQRLSVFTTRLDTLFGAQFIALSLKHPLVQAYAKESKELQGFLEVADDLPPDSKDGFLLPGIVANNALLHAQSRHTGSAALKPLLVYAAPYVLGNYGTGAVMGVPAHDIRDYAFWRHHRGSEPVRPVVDSIKSEQATGDEPVVEKGVLGPVCGSFAGQKSDEAAQAIVEDLQRIGYSVKNNTLWRLRDWLISRQRYWGAPIPMIHCHTCGAVPVPTEDLPVELPKLATGEFKGRSGNPLDQIDDWVNTACPKCQGPARRDTDTMDTFMDSAWYFFRFADPNNTVEPFESGIARKAMPVDYYVGGVEHAILHLLYARFMAKFLASCGQWPTDIAEPFRKLVTQGMVHGKTYSDPLSGRFLKPEEVEFSNEGNPKIKSTGETPNVSFEKMSKSKYNGVDPAFCMTKYGADVTRAHMLFAAPESEVLEWEEERISGVSRWLSKVWRVVHRANHVARPGLMRQAWKRTDGEYSTAESDLLHATKNTLESVTKKLDDAAGLNTVVSDLIKLTNSLVQTVVPYQSSDCEVNKQRVDAHEVAPSILLFCTEALIRMLAPLTPAFAEESWNVLHQDEELHFSLEGQEMSANMSIFEYSWPDIATFKDTDSGVKTRVCVLQVDGKRRFDCKIPVPREELSQEEVEEWLLDYVFERTPEGTKFMENPKNKELLGKMERFVVGKQGAVLNIVTAKEKKKAKP